MDEGWLRLSLGSCACGFISLVVVAALGPDQGNTGPFIVTFFTALAWLAIIGDAWTYERWGEGR